MPRLLLLASLLVLAVPAAAQSCSTALSRADASYQTGDFDATISRLTACLDGRAFSDEERRQAYRLVGLSYIGKDREADAREAVARLLEVAPNYEPDPALDPPPFVRLVDEMRRQRPDLRPATTRVASTAPGFGGTFRAHGMGYSDSDSDTFGGGGGDLTLGYGLSPALTLYAQLSSSAGTGDAPYDLALGSVGVGGRYHVGGGQARAVPFVGAAAQFQTATFSAAGASLDYTGPAGEVEGGLLYFLSPSLAVSGGISAAFASLSASTAGGTDSVSATTVRIGVGLTWQP